jgi:hypothetical protein
VHLAGIIPVANLQTDLQTVFPEVLLPLAPDFTAIQKSVYECALAGCQTIWIVANNDLAPIVRKSVGEWVYDPVYYNRTMTQFYREVRKEIPIYYVPIHPKDRDRRDCYGWSILYGAYSAWSVAYKISKWIRPQKYYVSFPLTAYSLDSLREHRLSIANKEKNFFLSYNNQTIKDNLPLAFTFTGDDFIKCRRDLNQKTTREFLPPLPGHRYPSQKRPLAERWTARTFDLATVFEQLTSTDSTIVSLEKFYDLSEWEQYCAFLCQENEKLIKKPYNDLIKPRFHVILPYTTGDKNEKIED